MVLILFCLLVKVEDVLKELKELPSTTNGAVARRGSADDRDASSSLAMSIKDAEGISGEMLVAAVQVAAYPVTLGAALHC